MRRSSPSLYTTCIATDGVDLRDENEGRREIERLCFCYVYGVIRRRHDLRYPNERKSGFYLQLIERQDSLMTKQR